jgi:hypothetical protein
MFFHCYHVALSGLVFRIETERLNFWTQLLPQIAHSNEAVKHALLAFSASLRIMKLKKEQSAISSSKLTTPAPEHFVLVQYNRSIHHLKQYTKHLTFENLEVALLCCLIFVSLETARGDTEATRRHLSSGLKIIDKLISTDFFLFCSIDENDTRSHLLEKTAFRSGFRPSRLSKNEWQHLLHFFSQYELGAVLYDRKTKPVISLRVLDMAIFFSTEAPQCSSPVDISKSCSHWQFHVFALLHQATPYKDDVEWWAGHEQRRMHEGLLSWGQSLLRRIDEFMKNPVGPVPKQSIEHYSVSRKLYRNQCWCTNDLTVGRSF